MTNEMRVSRPRKPGITGGQLVAAYNNKKQDLLEALSPVMLDEDLEKVKEQLLGGAARQITQEERLQWMHGNWKAKQDQVPESPDDMFCFRDGQGKEIRLSRAVAEWHMSRSDLSEDLWINHKGSAYKLLSVVKVTCGEAEKNAKGGD